MKFWDSSAIVPLVVDEPRTSSCRRVLRDDPGQVVWYFTEIEVISALTRLERRGALEADARQQAERELAKFMSKWTEIDTIEPVRGEAARILRVHPLRAADALQLAAARVACDGKPRRRGFVTLDDALFVAAEKEGFDALRPA